ncbi:glycosyltransferase [Sodalis sp. RH20]|uniref:glycosyltransferase n=1 Tax=unclassified Sodalis (in: enterobacteria) TaxID=2636512 RepID=UPI0039B42162
MIKKDETMKIKILHIADSINGGGAEAVLRDTIKAANNLGFENKLFISNGKTSPLSYIFSFNNFFKLYKNLSVIKPDIIHLQNYYHYLSPSILFAIKRYKKKNNCKIIFTAHDYHLICPNSGFQHFRNHKRINMNEEVKEQNIFFRYDHRSISHSLLKILQFYINYKIFHLQEVIDVIISPSNYLIKLFRNYGIKQNTYLIRNPIDFSSYIRNDKDNYTYPTASNVTTKFVFMGRVTEEKGISAFIDLLNENSAGNYELHIFGEGEELHLLKEKGLRRGVKLFFHGFKKREELPTLITLYDIFVLPSLWVENAPLSIIESAKAGLPILVPEYGGMKEMAALTKYYAFFSYQNSDLIYEFDNKIENLKNNTGKNYILHEQEFMFCTFQKKLKEVYMS